MLKILKSHYTVTLHSTCSSEALTWCDSKERERDGEEEKGQAVFFVHFCITKHR
jgi:hypothetical protein